MHIISSDFKKGSAKIHITQIEDLWYLSHIIDAQDLLNATTTRKIKIGDSENAKVTKKTINVTIQAEDIDFGASAQVLRINGKIKEGPEDIPKESYQAIELEVGTTFTIQKTTWLSYQKQKLEEATKPKEEYLFLIFDREEALFATTQGSRHHILLKLTGEVPKKAMKVEIKKDFYEQLIELLISYQDRFLPQAIILASPAFYKEDLFKKITSPELKKKITLATCYDVSASALSEIMRRPELQSVLKSSRARQEQQIIDELLHQINTQNKACYGLKEVKAAIAASAVDTFLISDEYIKKRKESKDFAEVDELMKSVEKNQGKIYIIASEGQAGKNLQGLGGIAALLRYKLSL